MIIEKVYYSFNTKTLNISIFDESNAHVVSSVMIGKDISGSASLVECISFSDITVLNNQTSPSTESTSVLTVHVDSIEYSDGSKFDPSDLISISIMFNGSKLSAMFYDKTQFYSYKLSIIDSGYGSGGDVRSAKKLARFSFYEQMLENAADMGLVDDANIYMNELYRMASYGIPYVKKYECYL